MVGVDIFIKSWMGEIFFSREMKVSLGMDGSSAQASRPTVSLQPQFGHLANSIGNDIWYLPPISVFQAYYTTSSLVMHSPAVYTGVKGSQE